MRFGINTLLFASPFTNEHTKLFPTFKQWGFDSVEIAIEDASHVDPAFLKAELDKWGWSPVLIGPVYSAMGRADAVPPASFSRNYSIEFQRQGIARRSRNPSGAPVCNQLWTTHHAKPVANRRSGTATLCLAFGPFVNQPDKRARN